MPKTILKTWYHLCLTNNILPQSNFNFVLYWNSAHRSVTALRPGCLQFCTPPVAPSYRRIPYFIMPEYSAKRRDSSSQHNCVSFLNWKPSVNKAFWINSRDPKKSMPQNDFSTHFLTTSQEGFHFTLTEAEGCGVRLVWLSSCSGCLC